MLPAFRSRTNLTRVLTQTLAARRQQDAFRVPVQNSSAVSVLTEEQQALNLKIWPGKSANEKSTKPKSPSRYSRRRPSVAHWLLSNRSRGTGQTHRSFRFASENVEMALAPRRYSRRGVIKLSEFSRPARPRTSWIQGLGPLTPPYEMAIQRRNSFPVSQQMV